MKAIRESSEGLQYPEHGGKRGTPSMGGLAIMAAVAGGYFLTHAVMWTAPTVTGLLALMLMGSLGLVGMADDYLKIFKQRSTGLRARTSRAQTCGRLACMDAAHEPLVLRGKA